MIYDIKEYVDFLCDKDIDANEYLLCMLLYEKDDDLIEKFKERFRIFEPDRDRYIRSMLKHLIATGYVEDFNTKDENGYKTYYLNMLMVTPRFTQEFIVDGKDAAEEFWTAYPKWLFIDKQVPAKSMDYIEFQKMYEGIIHKSKKKHEQMMQIIENYKVSNQYAEMGIAKYLGSRHWENLEDQFNAGDGYGESEA